MHATFSFIAKIWLLNPRFCIFARKAIALRKYTKELKYLMFFTSNSSYFVFARILFLNSHINHRTFLMLAKFWSQIHFSSRWVYRKQFFVALFCSYAVFFFSPWHPKCPWHKNSWILSRALLIFHGHFFENCHGLGQNFYGHFFGNFHGQIGNFTGISKNSCHGHFYVCHGHFCALISFFFIYSSHNKVDIWSLTCRESTIFSKKKALTVPVKLNLPL